MWRIGALLVVACFIEVSSNDLETGPLISRLRRSPQYWPPPPPPPPPPPYWPPLPPPPYWHHHHHHQECDGNFIGQGNSGYNNAPQKYQNSPEVVDQIPSGISQGQQGSPEHCDECDKKIAQAISNAQSGTGDAIAVAVAKASKQR